MQPAIYIYIYPSADECDMSENQLASGLTSAIQEANSELCCRELKKLATEKRRQLSLTSLASTKNVSANTVQATLS
jgi:hypothetical protein